MNKNKFSPYIRVAMYSVLAASFRIEQRVIFDYEIIYVGGGRCKITIDGKEYQCRKNDVVFLRPGIPHSFQCYDDCEFIQPHIHFDIVYDEKSERRFISYKPRGRMSEEELSLVSEDVLRDIKIPDVFIPCDTKRFGEIFFEIIDLYQKKGYNYELLYKAKLLELLDAVMVQFDRNTGVKQDTTNTLDAVKNYIDNNYFSVITLDALSKQFYYNKYTLMRKFRQEYDVNIISYYREKRIEYIKNALITTNLPINALAEKLNFSDIYSFSRFFKSSVGCSPTEYRKTNK